MLFKFLIVEDCLFYEDDLILLWLITHNSIT